MEGNTIQYLTSYSYCVSTGPIRLGDDGGGVRGFVGCVGWGSD